MTRKDQKQSLKTLWRNRLFLGFALTATIGFSATRVASLRHEFDRYQSNQAQLQAKQVKEGRAQLLFTYLEEQGIAPERAVQSNQSWALTSTSREEEVQALLQQALTSAEAIDDPHYKARALSSIAEAYGQIADTDTANALLQQALTSAEAIDSPQAKAWALSSIAEGIGLVATLMHLTDLQQDLATNTSPTSSLFEDSLARELLLFGVPTAFALISLLLLARQRSSLSFTGQLLGIFPEECVAEITALQQRIKATGKPEWYVQVRVLQEMLELILALYVQINLDNLRLPGNNQRIDDD